MAGKTKKSSQSGTSTTSPFPGVDALLTMGLKDVGQQYQGGMLGGYTGPTMTPFSRQSMDSFRQMERLNDFAQPGLNKAFRAATRMATGGSPTIDPFAVNSNSANGFATSFKQARKLLSDPLSGDQRRVRAVYGRLGSGQELDAENPYLDDVIQRGQDSALSRINATASGMGRYGSGVHQGTIARELGGIETNARYQNFDRERQRMDAANAALSNLGQQQIVNRHNAMNALSGLSQQGWNNDMNEWRANTNAQMTADQNAFNNQITAQQMLPGLYEAMMAPQDRLRAIGQEFENQNQGVINDQIRRYDMPYNNLAKLQAILAGAAPYSSVQTTGVTTQPGPSPFMQGLGGLGMIGSLFGGF